MGSTHFPSNIPIGSKLIETILKTFKGYLYRKYCLDGFGTCFGWPYERFGKKFSMWHRSNKISKLKLDLSFFFTLKFFKNQRCWYLFIIY